MRRRLTMAALLVGLLAVPTASWAATLFHSPSDAPEAPSAFPLRGTLPLSLNLWLDPEGETIFGLNMIITSSGSLTVRFTCVADNCQPNPVSELTSTMQVSLIAENSDPGWNTPEKIGTFLLEEGGDGGDELTLDSGSFTDPLFTDVDFQTTILAIVRGCGDGVRDPGEDCDGSAETCPDDETCGPSCTCLGPVPKPAQKCIKSINKGAAKVAKAQAGDNAACIKNGGKDKTDKLGPGGTIEACLTNDVKGKVAKAIGKIKTSDCPGGALSYLPGLKTDKDEIGEIMKQKDLDLIHAIFGLNLNESIVKAADDKPGSKCQSAIAKAAGKCQDAKLSTFNRCKKDKFKAGEIDIESCLGIGPVGIDDTKSKIGKKCGNGLGGTISKKCGESNTDALFPPCKGQDLGDCLDQKIECEVCKALNKLDGLSRDCDEFDGDPTGSCP